MSSFGPPPSTGPSAAPFPPDPAPFPPNPALFTPDPAPLTPGAAPSGLTQARSAGFRPEPVAEPYTPGHAQPEDLATGSSGTVYAGPVASPYAPPNPAENQPAAPTAQGPWPGAPTVQSPWAGAPTVQPWMVPPPPPSFGAIHSSSGAGRKVLIFALVAAALLIGVGAGTANAYAKHTICSAIESSKATNANSTDDTADQDLKTQIAEAHTTADQMRTYSHMLVFSPSLKSATTGLAEDFDQFADLASSATASGPDADTLAKALTVVGSLNTHARQAQRACGQPVTGILTT